MTKKEVANVLKISDVRVEILVRKGLLQRVKKGSGWNYLEDSVRAVATIGPDVIFKNIGGLSADDTLDVLNLNTDTFILFLKADVLRQVSGNKKEITIASIENVAKKGVNNVMAAVIKEKEVKQRQVVSDCHSANRRRAIDTSYGCHRMSTGCH